MTKLQTFAQHIRLIDLWVRFSCRFVPAGKLAAMKRITNCHCAQFFADRRTTLVEYIRFVKLCKVKADRVESPPKRHTAHQPQTLEELQREIEKCDEEIGTLEKRRDDNNEARKELTSRYKALYRLMITIARAN